MKTLYFFLIFAFLGLNTASAQTITPAQNDHVHTNDQVYTIETVLIEVAALLSEFKHDEAIALFDTIVPPGEDNSYLRFLRASVLSSAGRFAEARTIAQAISAEEPNNTDVLFLLAAIEGVTGRDREQQALLEQILRIDPDNAEALVALGNINLQRRTIRAAATHFDRVLSNDPQNLGALLGMGRALRMNQEFESAAQFFNRAVELYPYNAEARSERARFLRGRGLIINALDDLDVAKSVAPYDYWIAIDRGTLLLDINERSQALEEFKRAIEINPGEFLAYIYTSGLRDEFGDHDGAMRDYAILATLRPDYFFALEGLGLHKMRIEDWEAARDAFKEAHRQAPNEHLYALLAAINWMRMGDITSPRAFLGQTMTGVERNTLEWHMFRLFHDLTARNFQGETDMINRLERETDQALRARMLFFMGQYYDVRGMTNTANRFYLQVHDMNVRAIPEWRINEWILDARNIRPL